MPRFANEGRRQDRRDLCHDGRMSETSGYAVYLFPQAIEALGGAIQPYLQTGPAGPFVPCREVDTGGAFIEMVLEGRAPDGQVVELELMIPGSMVRMIVSARTDAEFGFVHRHRPGTVTLEPGMPQVPEAPTATAG